MIEKLRSKVRKLPNNYSRLCIRAAREIMMAEEAKDANVLIIRHTGNRVLE